MSQRQRAKAGLFFGQQVQPGQRAFIKLPLPSLYDCSPLEMPIHVIRGKWEGPTVCITAAIHGDELNGVEIIRHLLAKKKLQKLKGTILAIPVTNPFGFIFQDRYLMDRRDLNRSFPGSQTGSLASRLANTITKEILPKADYIIDLHAGSNDRSNFPQIRITGDHPKEEELAFVFNAPVILKAKERDGSLRKVAREQGIPTLLYEAGEALRFDEFSIRVGVRGVMNVLKALEMLPAGKGASLLERSRSAMTSSSFWIRSPYSGIFRWTKGLGQRVKKGEVIGYVGSPVTWEDKEVKSPAAGIVIGLNKLPLVHEGAALFNLGCFESVREVEKEIQEFQTELAVDYIDMHIHIEH